MNLKKIISASILFSLLFFSVSSRSSMGYVKNILILNSYHIGMEWEDEVMRGISETLKESNTNVGVYVEYLDSKRYTKEEVDSYFNYIFKKKYKEKFFDLIIAVDDNALKFLIEKEVYKTEKIIFVGINSTKLAEEAFNSYGMTGIVEKVEIESTVDLILKLHPQVRKIVAIIDRDNENIHSREDEFLKLRRKRFENKIEFEVLKDWSFESLKDKIASYTSEVALLLMSFHKDSMGNMVSYNHPYSYFAGLRIPTYTLWKSHGIGQGVVGGYVTYGYFHGKNIGLVGLNILDSYEQKVIPVEYSISNIPIIDYSLMNKFNIKTKNLPKNVIFVNKPLSFYRQYFFYIWSYVLLLLIQLIAFLLIFLVLKYKILNTREEMEQEEIELLMLKHEIQRLELVNKQREAYKNSKSIAIVENLSKVFDFVEDSYTSNISKPQQKEEEEKNEQKKKEEP